MQSADKPTRSEIDLAFPQEKTQDEIKIQETGDIDALQRYRWKVVNKGPSYVDRAIELLRIEQDLRNTAQEEKCLEKKTETVGSWPLYRNDVQAELQVLNKRYWVLERQWWKVRNSFVEGPLIRAFDLWRSHPLWYMHRVLFEDCVRRGGCCSRRCGCCVDRNTDERRQLGAGHCTIECGCCHQARGFELTKREKKKFLSDFHIVNDGGSLYRQKINRVSIWGLSIDSHDSPFDLIVTPPGCESDVSKEQMSKEQEEQIDEPFVIIDEEDKEEVVMMSFANAGPAGVPPNQLNWLEKIVDLVCHQVDSLAPGDTAKFLWILAAIYLTLRVANRLDTMFGKVD
ncbi:unnamed protein product [Penicillium glandicola]